MDREQKIKMIKGLVSGEINPQDIKPKSLIMTLNSGGGTDHFIDSKPVPSDEFWEQSNKQRVSNDESTSPEIIVDGISMNDPDYQDKIVAKGIANGTIRTRQIGINNFESY